MNRQAELKRMNFYVNPADLDRVALELGCRPSEVVRRLVDNYILAMEIDEVRRMPGDAPEQLFRRGEDYSLPHIPESVELETVE